jgi:hypothetical protein
MKMKAGLIAPLYLSFSWVLTVSYQIFTDTAVNSIAFYINQWSPSAGLWLSTNINTVVFIYSFTWIFVLSSVVPSLILGKQRSIMIQYAVVLTLTLLSVYMGGILFSFGFDIQQLLGAASFLQNPLLASVYLAVPYLFMVGMDIRIKQNQMKNDQLTMQDLLNKT